MSVTVSYPGVYIEELPSGVHPITGVATSIAAFVGWTNQGPSSPQLVLSWSEYARMYGGFYQGAQLGYAVAQFFGNGGGQAYIIRLTDAGLSGGTAAVASLTLPGTAPAPATPPPVAGPPATPPATPPTPPPAPGSITFQAATQGETNPGKWADNYGVVIKAQSGSPTRFSLQVVYNPNPGKTAATVVESFVNLSAIKPDPQGRFVDDILKTQSNYISVQSNSLTVAPTSTTVATGNLVDAKWNLANGLDGALLTPSVPGTPGDFEKALLDPY